MATDFIRAENIMLEPEVMRHYGREDLGVAIPEGGGYIGTLNVYHECKYTKLPSSLYNLG
jgi:hypothetical protein